MEKRKSVKAIAPTGAALAFLCFDFFFRIVKGVQPLTTGCGTQHPLRALGGTRVLLAAVPTTAPCFRRWRRSQLLHCGAGGVQRWGGGNRNTPTCLWPSGASLRAESKQKVAIAATLHLPFSSTILLVKKMNGKIRRFSRSSNIKIIIIPLSMRRATRSALKSFTPRQVHCQESTALSSTLSSTASCKAFSILRCAP